MAYFSKLNNSNIVIETISVNNAVITDENGNEIEQKGIDFLRNLYNEPESNWKKTSYNTKGGKYYEQTNNKYPILSQDQSKAFRKNYAHAGYIYDAQRDAFIPPKVIYKGTTLNFNCYLINTF
jgi:hypothetical protein